MINEFIRGGNSQFAMMGTMAGRAFMLALKLAFIVLVLVIAVGVGQFSQAMASYGDVRKLHLEQWALGDQERTEHLDLFIKECLVGKPANTDEPIKPVPIKPVPKCAERIGAPGIVNELEAVNKVLVTYSWPLSLITQKID